MPEITITEDEIKDFIQSFERDGVKVSRETAIIELKERKEYDIWRDQNMGKEGD